jgi:hypothetical protein
MFDLNQRIAEWRREMEKALGRPRMELDELEDHLRGHIEQLVGGGAGEAEAFQTAVARLGSASAMREEFRKTRAGIWWPARIALVLAAVVVVGVSAAIGARVFQGRTDLLLAAHVFLVATGYCLAFVIGGLGMCFVGQELARGRGGPPHAGLSEAVSILSVAAAVFVGSGVGLGMVWASLHLGRSWAWDPKETGGAAVFVWLLLLAGAQRRAPANERLVMMMGICASLLTSLAWFGEGLMAAGLKSYGAIAGGAPPFSGLILIHLGFLLLGMIPRRAAPEDASG